MPLHLMRPVGPLPPAVYWRRRAGVVALVVLLLVLLSRCGGDEPEQLAQQPAPSGAPTTSAPAVTPLPTTTTPPAVVPCADQVLRVSATPGRARYPRGVRPVLRLAVRNGGTVPCTRPLGGAAVELVVLSGRDRIWSSDDCQRGGSQGPVVLRPQELRVITLAWDARRSRPGCTGTREPIEAGTYRVVGRVGTLRTAGTSFLVG